ncbi:Tamavidin2, avidin-like biotin-binding proteins from an edible mushroom [Mycena pura]|uniref:Tamavidin2, avidin-like biotin-binding proteins from an edible mushroom n=1 Tax=Mycena pura TaxID=153505 RepID=A0AAD6YFG9_9AGAR|nr:Tamavidin2, avidin-like biotin-binding proteins from an edible mushroom [Mycena pura]
MVDVDWDRLKGVWYNELGSNMSLNIFDERGGEFSGEYNSTVGKAVNSYGLSGWVDSDPPRGQGISIGWAVSYRNAHSTATWSGQFFDSDHAGEGHDDHHDHGGKIITQWLLTTSTLPGPKNTWNSTHLGRDTFTRRKPSHAEIAQARAMTCMTDGSPRMEDILSML